MKENKAIMEKVAAAPAIEPDKAKELITKAGFEFERHGGDHDIWAPSEMLLKQLSESGVRPVFDISSKKSGSPLLVMFGRGASKNTVELYRNVKDALRSLGREDLLAELMAIIGRPNKNKPVLMDVEKTIWAPKWFGQIEGMVRKNISLGGKQIAEELKSFYARAKESESSLTPALYNKTITALIDAIGNNKTVKISNISDDDFSIAISVICPTADKEEQKEKVEDFLELLGLEDNADNRDNVLSMIDSYDSNVSTAGLYGMTKMIKLGRFLFSNGFVSEAAMLLKGFS